MQACSRRRALSRSSCAGGIGGARLRKSRSDSAASVEKRKKSNFAAADKEESGGSSAVQLKKSLSDLPISLTDRREMFVDKEMDKNGEKPRSAEEEEEEEQIPVSVEDEEKNQSLESSLSVDVVEKEQIVLVADRNAEVEEEEEEEEDSEMQCVENAVMNLESEARAFILDDFENQSVEREEQQEQEEQEEKCEVVSSTRMQSIEDLVMWKDASRSALVFGFGTFLLLSSSYAEEVRFSMISASSYVGLIYLAFVFLCKSFIRRGEEQFQCHESCNVVEEEDAIWLLKMLLPYVNELLLKLKTLFSGDPSTTLKLAGVLFVMARCGSNITIWSLVRLIFFGVFIVPKVCCSYSSHLTKLGRFWLDRVRDGWESCTHKKAATIAIFCVIWNISSTIARVWSFFMLVVAVKLYQQSAAESSSSREGGEEQKEGQEDSMAGQSQLLKLH